MSGLAMSHDSRAHSACLSVHLGAARRLFDRALSPLDMVQEEADSQRGTFTFFHPGLPAIDIPSRPSHPKSPRVVTICDHARHAERPGLCTFKGSAHVKAFGKQFASWHLHRQTHVAVQIMWIYIIQHQQTTLTSRLYPLYIDSCPPVPTCILDHYCSIPEMCLLCVCCCPHRQRKPSYTLLLPGLRVRMYHSYTSSGWKNVIQNPVDFCHLCSAASYFFSTLVGNATLWHKANSRTVLSLEDLAVWLCWAPVQQGPRLPKQQNLELKMETHCGWEHHSRKYEISVESLSDAFRHNSNLLESVKFLKELTCTDSGFWCYWCPMVSLKVLTCYGKNWWSRLADAVVLNTAQISQMPAATWSNCFKVLMAPRSWPVRKVNQTFSSDHWVRKMVSRIEHCKKGFQFGCASKALTLSNHTVAGKSTCRIFVESIRILFVDVCRIISGFASLLVIARQATPFAVPASWEAQVIPPTTPTASPNDTLSLSTSVRRRTGK